MKNLFKSKISQILRIMINTINLTNIVKMKNAYISINFILDIQKIISTIIEAISIETIIIIVQKNFIRVDIQINSTKKRL